MLTVNIECRQIKEWDEATQKKIVEKHRDINVKYDSWYEGTIGWWKEKLEPMGYYDVNISFSGFWSQGDGASYTGYINMIKWLEHQNNPRYSRILKLLKSGALEHSAEIKRDRWHNYVHWNTTSIYHEWAIGGNSHPNVEALLDAIEEEVIKDHQSLNKEIYNDLEKDHDGQCTDEAVIDTLEANEYELSAEGKIYQ